MSAISGTADEFGNVPCLSGPVAEIGIIGTAFIGSMSLFTDKTVNMLNDVKK